jgi:hypothetical protein
MHECEFIERCGFFKKYRTEKRLACEGFIQQFCRGPKMEQCRRRAYLLRNGATPPDDMLPNGRMIVKRAPSRTVEVESSE